jgi:tRNA (adenine57-N1/adenine58-N1)-methyltransferase
MHGHTGFLITSRRLAPGVVPPERTRRPAKGSHPVVDGVAVGTDGIPAAGSTPMTQPGSLAAVDVPDDAWTPEAMGERVKSDKTIRRVRRSLTETSDDN